MKALFRELDFVIRIDTNGGIFKKPTKEGFTRTTYGQKNVIREFDEQFYNIVLEKYNKAKEAVMLPLLSEYVVRCDHETEVGKFDLRTVESDWFQDEVTEYSKFIRQKLNREMFDELLGMTGDWTIDELEEKGFFNGETIESLIHEMYSVGDRLIFK
jgi:hypothetical protein